MSLHTYSRYCSCEKCELETSLQKAVLDKAKSLCAAHGGQGMPCEICLDVASGADHVNPVLSLLGHAVAVAVGKNFSSDGHGFTVKP